MKIPRLAILGCLAFAACGRTPAPAPTVPTPTPPFTASQSPPPPPTATPSPAVLPTAATPEQLGSTLRLRVAFGGMPASDTAAALLRQGEITGYDLSRSDARLVLALLKGWDESRLRSADARLVAYRRKVDARGNPTVVTFPAKLVRFDPATGLALLTYTDTFDYALDAGFRLQRGGDPVKADLTVLRTSQDGPREMPGTTPAAGPHPPATHPSYTMRSDARFSIDSGTYRGTASGPARLDLPDLGSQAADTAVLAVGAPDLLCGFVEITAAGPVLIGLDRFDPVLTTLRYEVEHVGFEKFQDYGGLRIKVAVTSATDGPPPGQLGLRIGAANDIFPANMPSPEPDGSFAPVASETIRLNPPYTPGGPWMSGNLPLPPDKQERFYLMQLSWPVLPGKNVPEICGRPFLVKIANRPEGIFPELITEPGFGSNGVAAAQENGVARFPLEAPALEVHLVAGGREALIHLAAPPFWKRFSFEKNDWQALPEHLANCIVTGNLTALFILDLDALEVRKYRLPDLTPEGTAKLPAGDYQTILAGANTACTPVHLVVGSGTMSLDPNTLEVRYSPPDDERYSNSQRYPGVSNGPKQFYISGDGREVLRADGSSHNTSYYNADTRGFERLYLGTIPGNHTDYVPGITPGYKADARDVTCYDTRGGAALAQAPLQAPWLGSAAVLSENAPVVFRVLPSRGNELPPRVRLGCFALLDNVPFAEIEAPELAGLNVGTLPWQRWVFLDPYSRRLATLDLARQTWRVRSLRAADVSRPAVLNWPDTSVARGGIFTFRPELAGNDHFTMENVSKPAAAVVDTASGTASLPVAADEFDSLQLLMLRLPTVSGSAPVSYPLLLHAAGSDLPFAAAPDTNPNGLGRRGADLATLGASTQGLVPIKAALYSLPESFPLMVGPTAGHVALVSRSGRVALFSVQARRIVATFDGPANASYYAGLGGLLEYDPGRRTLARLSVPGGRREATLSLPERVRLTGVAAGAEPGGAVTLTLQTDHPEKGTRLADLVVPEFSNGVVAILDGTTLKAGTRAQVSTLAHLLGQPEPFPDIPGGSVGANTDAPPVLLPSSRDGTAVSLSGHLVVAGPGYAVGYPWGAGLAGTNLTSSSGGLAGGSISGLMAFAGNGIGFKAGAAVWQPGTGSELGPTPDGRYRFHQLGIGLEETSMEVCAAENNHPLIRLGRMPFLQYALPYPGREEVGRRVLMLGDAGPLAILNATGRTLALVDLDVAALARQLSPGECHVVSQPVPYVMEGKTWQYTLQVNNPAAVQSVRLQQPAPGLTLNGSGTVFYSAPSGIKAATRTVVSLEIKTKNGQVLRHEFPVYVLPLPRAGTRAKTGQL